MGQAQNIPDAPNPPRLVNDLVGILDGSQINQLESALVEFNDQTSTQIVVAIVSTLDGTEASDFAFKLGEKWGIGQKGKNNGILILIKPKVDGEKGKAFIAVGYGLEGVVPDAIANRIVNNEMIPRFKQNDYYGGIVSAVNVIVGLTKGEFTAENYGKSKSKSKDKSPIGIIVFVIIIVIIAIISGSNNNNHKNNMGGSNLPFWMLLGAALGSSSSRGSSGGFGGFSSGGGSFGGFGGGSFGGGGSGGSW